MASQTDVLGDPNYIAVLDYGFVGLVDHMGDDHAITTAARVSYGAGTKAVSTDRGLIRYLMRHLHTSPFEMVSFKFHIKLPIFVMRQIIRHRTMSTNEYSGRFSVMTDEAYLPDRNDIQPQASANKQGRDGVIDDLSREGVTWLMQTANDHAFRAYQVLLGEREGAEDHYDPYATGDALLSPEFPGVARELARTVLPLTTYTEAYISLNLWNLFRFLHLRKDPRAQTEIRVYADAMYELIKPLVPLACEALEDYLLQAKSLSRLDQALLRHVLVEVLPTGSVQDWLARIDRVAVADAFGMSRREFDDFAVWLSASSQSVSV